MHSVIAFTESQVPKYECVQQSNFVGLALLADKMFLARQRANVLIFTNKGKNVGDVCPKYCY
jgi:hypothetical protein